MEPIPDIDLTQETQRAEAEILEDERRQLRKIIRGIVNDLKNWKLERIRLEKELTKVDEKVAKATRKYQALTNGDWSVLNENMLTGKASSETAT